MSSPLFRWVAEGQLSLTELLKSHGLERALPGGRVFVNAARVQAPLELAVGAVVEVFAPRPSAAIDVLFERDGICALAKPAELPTEPDKSGNDCALAQLAERLGVDGSELFAVSRLDVGVSGVLLVATSARSRNLILQERARGSLRRRYVALACGVPQPTAGQWCDALGKGSRGKRIVDGHAGQAAQTLYRVAGSAKPVSQGKPDTSLLALSPITGRTHQLRVHASAHGAPLLGDRRYAGPMRMTAADGSVRSFRQVLLHAAWVEWGPRSARQRVVSEPTTDLHETWLALGGDAAALQRALED